jgi:hypothetical protein
MLTVTKPLSPRLVGLNGTTSLVLLLEMLARLFELSRSEAVVEAVPSLTYVWITFFHVTAVCL